MVLENPELIFSIERAFYSNIWTVRFRPRMERERLSFEAIQCGSCSAELVFVKGEHFCRELSCNRLANFVHCFDT